MMMWVEKSTLGTNILCHQIKPPHLVASAAATPIDYVQQQLQHQQQLQQQQQLLVHSNKAAKVIVYLLPI